MKTKRSKIMLPNGNVIERIVKTSYDGFRRMPYFTFRHKGKILHCQLCQNTLFDFIVLFPGDKDWEQIANGPA